MSLTEYEYLPKPYPLYFSGGNCALAQDIAHRHDLPGALRDLAPPRPVLVLVGGANSLEKEVAGRVFPMFRDSLVPLMEGVGGTVIDGGTDSGVMALMGRAHAQADASFPLIGVAARGTVGLPGKLPTPTGHKGTPLEANHTRFLLVPGDHWGDESPWITAAASTLAQNTPSATLAVGGGEVTRLDLELSLQAKRRTLLLAGSGGTTDEFALALRAERLDALGIGAAQARSLVEIESNSAGDVLSALLRGALCS